MTVKELKEFLNSLPPEMEEAQLICQKDSEGNDYSPLAGVDTESVYSPGSSWYGDVYDLKWTADEACLPKKEWEKIKKMPKCVVLYPIN